MHIGSRLELFVDGFLVEKMRGTALKLHSPQPQEVAIRFDRPWEGPCSAYPSVLQDGDEFRLYYRGWATDHSPEVTCLAQSVDGKKWVKPKLGLCEWKGSRDNNIVWTGYGNHCFAPFIDLNPATKKSERYKAIAGCPPVGLVSPDGLHWKQVGKPPLISQGAFDSLNLAFWDSTLQHYVAYVRTWDDGGGRVTNDFTGYRSIGRVTSPDFCKWSDTVEIDYGNSPREQLYTNAITPYPRAPHIYLAFPKRFMEARQRVLEYGEPGISETVFMTSRDGHRWDRRFMEAMIRPGRDRFNWTDRSIMTAWGLLQTAPDELSLYYTENYKHRTNRLRRASLRLDGFVSVNAPFGGGQMVTRPFTFTGSELVLNYATSAVGSLQVEIQDENGKAVPGFALKDCPVMYGDEIAEPVSWIAGSDVSAVAGRTIKLRFAMKDADLFSLQFRA